MSSNRILIALVALAAAFPVSTAAARPGKGNGKGNDHSKQESRSDGDRGKGNGDRGKGNADRHSSDTGEQSVAEVSNEAVRTAPTKPRLGSRNYVVRGTVEAVDLTTNVVTVAVTTGPGGTNHAALAWRGQSVQFDASEAFLSLNDSNADQVTDLNDLVVGARVQVQAFLLSTDAQPYPVRRITAHWNVPASTETATDESTASTTTDGD